jgi:hypothetical protein
MLKQEDVRHKSCSCCEEVCLGQLSGSKENIGPTNVSALGLNALARAQVITMTLYAGLIQIAMPVKGSRLHDQGRCMLRAARFRSERISAQ